MRKTLPSSLAAASLALALASALALPREARAEEKATRPDRTGSTFRIDYVLFELEGGKRTNERSFTLTANDGSHAQIRSGTRVPLDLGEKGIQYMDVGLKISGRVLERDTDLTLDSEVEMSTFALPEQVKETRGNPVLRTVTQSFSTRPVLGKPSILSSLDDLGSRKRYQVEVTVTRVR